MKKLFISQPMNGKSDEQILKERSAAIVAASALIGEDVEVLETFYDDFAEDSKPLEYLGRSISDLAKADAAYFVKGWKERRGCKIEYLCAKNYGIPTIEQDKELTFSFGQALEYLKEGNKIARKGWNGKGMFVVYQKGYPQGISCNKQTADAWGIDEGDLFRCEPYLQIKMVNGSHAMWVPSINDVLANDWVTV